MSRDRVQKPKPKSPPQRRAIRPDGVERVKVEPLAPGRGLPLLATPGLEGVDLAAWMRDHRGWMQERLLRHGGILFRGFALAGPEELEAVVQALAGEPMAYTYRSTPRKQVRGEIYTSTEYPASQSIPLHNEMSYSRQWPMKILFLCVQPAERGGATPIADSHRVFERIEPRVREAFARRGVMYVRNYGAGVDLPWQEVFQTDDRERVERFCAGSGIEVEWLPGDRLRTRQVCQGVASHPRGGEPLWFNQAHLFHVSSLPEAVRDHLLAQFAEDELPRHAFYGDGTPIEAAALEEIRAAYDAETVTFPWSRGDLLVLDNMRVAHGREPYSGPRRILVGMAEASSAGAAAEAGGAHG